MERRLEVLLVDPAGALGQVERALDVADESATVETVASPAAIAGAEDPDCVVVLDSDAVDGIEQLDAALGAVDGVPVVPVSVAPSPTFAAEARSAGAADVVCVPEGESADELFPDALARRLRDAAGRADPFEDAGGLLDSLLEDHPHQVFIKNRYGRFEDASRTAAAEYDLDRDQLVGLTDSDLIPPDVVEELRAEEREIMATEEPVINKIEHFVDEEGRDRWMSTTKAPRYDSDGEVVGITGTTREVTEGKRQEEMMNALHAASRRLLAAETRREIAEVAVDIAEDVPDLPLVQVTFLDDDGDLVPVAASADERGSANRDRPDPFERYEALFRRCYETRTAQFAAPGDGASNPRSRPREDGTEPEGMVLPLGDHGALGFAATSGTFDEFGVDLAEVLAANVEAALDRAAREETLERQNERLEEFAGIVSHDLRNPLTVAQGYVDLLDSDEQSSSNPPSHAQEDAGGRDASSEPSLTNVREDAEAQDASSPRSASPHEDAEDRRATSPDSKARGDDPVEQIDRALGRIESLTDDLLTLARSGDVVGETEPETLDGVAFEAWRAVDTGSASLRAAGSLGTVEADRARLLELFENLFANAIEHAHSPADPVTVTVGSLPDGERSDGSRTSDDERSSVGGFYVEDDGPGIPDERRGDVFARGSTAGADGAGLGLHIVETIAEAHGWSVRTTDGVDGGVRFEFTGLE